jgi:hypothetical protein
MLSNGYMMDLNHLMANARRYIIEVKIPSEDVSMPPVVLLIAASPPPLWRIPYLT